MKETNGFQVAEEKFGQMTGFLKEQQSHHLDRSKSVN